MKSWQDIIYKPSFKIKNDDKPSIPDEANVNKVSAENRGIKLHRIINLRIIDDYI